MWNSKRLILAHFWLAFAGFGLALLLGAWQMLVRSPLHAWISDPELYYRSSPRMARRWPMCSRPWSRWVSATRLPRLRWSGR